MVVSSCRNIRLRYSAPNTVDTRTPEALIVLHGTQVAAWLRCERIRLSCRIAEITLENVAIANALQLEVVPPRRRTVVLGCFGHFCNAPAHKLLFPGFCIKIPTSSLDLAARFHKKEHLCTSLLYFVVRVRCRVFSHRETLRQTFFDRNPLLYKNGHYAFLATFCKALVNNTLFILSLLEALSGILPSDTWTFFR